MVARQRYRRGKFDLESFETDDVALLAHYGDTESVTFLWQQSTELAERIAGNFIKRYAWIDVNDLSQSILLEFPKIIKRYKPMAGTPFAKYLYFSFYRAAQDSLRKEDPLGIRIPQKAHYPDWIRLSEYGEDQALIEVIVHEGLRRLDSGEHMRCAMNVEDKDWKLADTQMPSMPITLQGEAAKEWLRIERYLVALDRVAAVDRQALTTYCTQWARFARIMQVLAPENASLYADGPTCEVPHPLLAPLVRSARAIIKLAGQFGMTARTRDLESDHGNRKASSLKRLMGNQRKIAEGKLAPSILPMMPDWTPDDMIAPFWLNARANDEFERLGSELTVLDLFTPLDLVPLVVVSSLFDLYLRSGEQMKDMLTYTRRFDKETQEVLVFEKEHPLHKIQTDIYETMNAIWKDYGQTPRFRKVFNGERKVETKEIPIIFKGKFG